MTTITVKFDVPGDILLGLGSGRFERVGGVIRHVDTKQVFAWLREGGQLNGDTMLAPNLLSSVLSATGMNAATVTAISSSALPLLAVAIVGYEMLRLRAEIDDLKNKIAEIYDRVDRQFEREREVNRETALKVATNLLEVHKDEYKRQMVGQATDRLTEATQQLIWDINELLDGESNLESLEQAQSLIMLAFEIDTMSVRCFLEVDEFDAARRRISDSLNALQPLAHSLVRSLVGDRPALYFHESVDDEYFDRYIQIEQWLRSDRDILKTVVNENRAEFWKEESIESIFTLDGLRRRVQDSEPFYLKTIPQAEILIEEFQRFKGFESELDSMERLLVFSETLSESDVQRIDERDDFVLIIDNEMLDRVEKLSG